MALGAYLTLHLLGMLGCNRKLQHSRLGRRHNCPRFKDVYATAILSPLNGNKTVGDINDVQSIRQGCPLSMHFLAIYIEPLLARMAQNLEGVNLNGKSGRQRFRR